MRSNNWLMRNCRRGFSCTKASPTSTRVNQLLDRIGATLKQCLKHASVQGALPATHDFAAQADLLVCYTLGRWQRFVKSNFKDDPMAHWLVQSAMLLK